ncbi:aminomethyltransferase family protein [Agrobacterium sp. LAD9]|uniref:aminomethyltransferase family protein n=1 Tax=Agrobacterium sp. LAD9 TaxID=2055153 RepID=UPI000D1E1658|nr:aminomethyltransferase family protein [Agrobacterium sp. LAD9]
MKNRGLVDNCLQEKKSSPRGGIDNSDARSEIEALYSGVGIVDLTSRGKFEISGPDACNFMNLRLAVNAPGINDVIDAPALDRSGGVTAIWRTSQPAEGIFYLTGPGQYAQRDFDSLRSEMSGSVRIINLTCDRDVLAIAGPLAAVVLTKIGWRGGNGSKQLPSGADDGWIGEIPARLVLTVRGEVVIWEFHILKEDRSRLYELFLTAGASFQITDIGTHMLASMRAKAGVPMIGLDIPFCAHPQDVGPPSWIHIDKPDFVGKSAYLARKLGIGSRLVRFMISRSIAEPGWIVEGGNRLLVSDKSIGHVTSASFTNDGDIFGFALVDPDTDPPNVCTVEILGQAVEVCLIPL